MDIEELAERMTNLEKQQEAEVEDQIGKRMKKFRKSLSTLELYLYAALIGPIILAGIGLFKDGFFEPFYLIVLVMAAIGIVMVALIKNMLLQLIYIELAARGHGRDD